MNKINQEDDRVESVFLKSKICKTCDKIISGNEFTEIKEHQELGHKVIDDNRDGKQTLHDAVKPVQIDNTSDENNKIGLAFTHNKTILDEIQNDLNKAHVGDNKNKVLIVILLASSKRKGHEQAVIIQKQSSAGGSNLQKTCLSYFDDKITLTRMTGAYLDRSEVDYSGKILAIGEMSGFDSSSSSLRQKLSEGKTELATTDKDAKGRIITGILRTEGRPSFITTTTSEEIHPELENRCWILSVDETPSQTKSVNKYQFAKDTFEYEEWEPRSEIKAIFNSGILEDLKVVNPFTELLGESFPCDNVTARRDSRRFAELVTTISYIHQHQRIKIKTKNQTIILTAYEDLQHALYYGQDALKSTLNKLNEKTESVLEFMKAAKDKEFFTRNELCEALGIPYETMKRILTKLVNRSFVEEDNEDRIWKYKLTNKGMIAGISFGSEDDFTKTALGYLSKNASNFEEISMPPNYTNMNGPDAAIVKYLLSLGDTVTIENGVTAGTDVAPITISPFMRVTDTEDTQTQMPVTRISESEQQDNGNAQNDIKI